MLYNIFPFPMQRYSVLGYEVITSTQTKKFTKIQQTTEHAISSSLE